MIKSQCPLQGKRGFLLESELDTPWVITWFFHVSQTSNSSHLGSLHVQSLVICRQWEFFLLRQFPSDLLTILAHSDNFSQSFRLISALLLNIKKSYLTPHPTCFFPRGVYFLFLFWRNYSAFLKVDLHC